MKTLAQLDVAFQPSIKPEQIESLHRLAFFDRRENMFRQGPPGVGKSASSRAAAPHLAGG